MSVINRLLLINLYIKKSKSCNNEIYIIQKELNKTTEDHTIKITNLMTKIKNEEDTNQNLGNDIEELKEKNENLIREYNKLKEQFEIERVDLNKELNNRNKLLTTMSEGINKLDEKYKNLEKLNKQNLEEIKLKSNEITNMALEITKAKKKNEELELSILKFHEDSAKEKQKMGDKIGILQEENAKLIQHQEFEVRTFITVIFLFNIY